MESTFPDGHVSGQGGTRTDMRKIADNAIVIDGSTGINDAMPSYDHVGLDHGPRKDDGTLADRSGWIDVSMGMHNRSPFHILYFKRQPFADAVVPDGYHTCLASQGAELPRSADQVA